MDRQQVTEGNQGFGDGISNSKVDEQPIRITFYLYIYIFFKRLKRDKRKKD